MKEQWAATFLGFLAVFGVRMIEWWFPKGYHSKWADKHSVKDEDNEGEDAG